MDCTIGDIKVNIIKTKDEITLVFLLKDTFCFRVENSPLVYGYDAKYIGVRMIQDTLIYMNASCFNFNYFIELFNGGKK